jgi:hypothetical protein
MKNRAKSADWRSIMSINPNNHRDWLRALGALVATGGMSLADARERLVAYADLLESEFDQRFFTMATLAFVGRRCRFFPTFHELCLALSEWGRDNPIAIPNQIIRLPDNATSLSAKDRHWLAYYHGRERENFAPLRESDGRLSRPDVADWRGHTLSLVKQMSRPAYDFIRDEEARR